MELPELAKSGKSDQEHPDAGNKTAVTADFSPETSAKDSVANGGNGKHGRKNGQPGWVTLVLVALAAGFVGGLLGGIASSRYAEPIVWAIYGVLTGETGGSKSSFTAALGGSDTLKAYSDAQIVTNEDDPETGSVTIGDETYKGKVFHEDAVDVLFDSDAGVLVFGGDGVAYTKNSYKNTPNRLTSDESRLVREMIFLTGITDIETTKKGLVENYENLLRVTICGDVNSIGREAFIRCTNLRYVAFLGACQRIETFAFYACKSLTNDGLVLPANTVIKRDAFYLSSFQP